VVGVGAVVVAVMAVVMVVVVVVVVVAVVNVFNVCVCVYVCLSGGRGGGVQGQRKALT
jgi:hypothetical protein